MSSNAPQRVESQQFTPGAQLPRMSVHASAGRVGRRAHCTQSTAHKRVQELHEKPTLLAHWLACAEVQMTMMMTQAHITDQHARMRNAHQCCSFPRPQRPECHLSAYLHRTAGIRPRTPRARLVVRAGCSYLPRRASAARRVCVVVVMLKGGQGRGRREETTSSIMHQLLITAIRGRQTKPSLPWPPSGTAKPATF
jgi:hypothetical protein